MVRTPLFRATGRSGPDVSRAERVKIFWRFRVTVFCGNLDIFGYSSAYIFVYSTWRNTQGSEMPAKTLSIRYYTYHIILGINTAGIMGL